MWGEHNKLSDRYHLSNTCLTAVVPSGSFRCGHLTDPHPQPRIGDRRIGGGKSAFDSFLSTNWNQKDLKNFS